MNYLDLGFDQFGIRSVQTATKDAPWVTRNSYQPGALIADGVYIGVNNNVFKIDKDGIYLGGVVPTYEESRIYYDSTTHKLKVGGVSGWETVSSS
jgi:hypothetical protein